MISKCSAAASNTFHIKNLFDRLSLTAQNVYNTEEVIYFHHAILPETASFEVFCFTAMIFYSVILTPFVSPICLQYHFNRSLREPAGPCTKSMEVSESRMERVNWQDVFTQTEGIRPNRKGMEL